MLFNFKSQLFFYITLKKEKELNVNEKFKGISGVRIWDISPSNVGVMQQQGLFWNIEAGSDGFW